MIFKYTLIVVKDVERYELSGNANIEWYDCINGEKTDSDYHSAIWIPVRRKA